MKHLPCRRAGAVQLGHAWHGTGAGLRFRRPVRLVRPTSRAFILSSSSRSKVYQPSNAPSPSINNFEIEFPRLEEVEGGKAFQGALAGVIIGTALSLGVSTVKASFVAGVTAAFVALVPILGGIDIEDELENEDASLPGVAVASAAVQGKQALQGKKPLTPDNTATVLAASVSAGALVAIFAAKSLGIAIAGAAGFITLRRDGNYNLQKSTRSGRDYLRTRGYSGPGVAASLLLLQAKDAAIKVGDAVQGRRDAFSEGSFSRSFPSEEGVYSISQALPLTASQPSQARAGQSAKAAPTSAEPLKSAGQSETSPAKQEPAGNLLEEALRLRGGNGSQKAAAASPSNGNAPTESSKGNGSAAPSENEDLLKQAMEFRGQGSGLPDPEDPKDKKKSASPAAKPEVPKAASQEPQEDLLAQALKFRESGKGDSLKPKAPPRSSEKQTPAVAKQGPQEDLLAEAMKFRQSGSGNGSKPSRAASKPQPSPGPTSKAAASPGPSQGSQPESGNLLEEALRLRSGGTSKALPPPPQPATARAPAAAQSSPDATFKGERSDDLIFQAQDAASATTPGQQPLKASAEGSESEKNVDLLGKSWQDSSVGKQIKQSSAASLPRSDSLIMQSQQSNGGKPEGMPKLSIGSAGSSGKGQINPAASRGPSLGGRATEQPLKGALQRQQEQSKVRGAGQEGSPSLAEEESEEGEGLLAEALRLRGQPLSSETTASAKPAAAKIEEPVESPAKDEDLLASALKFRGEQSISSGSNGSPPAQKAEEADEKLSQGEDLLAEALRFRDEQPAKTASSAGSKQPSAKIDKAEKAEERVSEGEDLLAEALRLRAESPPSRSSKKAAPEPAAAKVSTNVDDLKNSDLLAEALRLRAEGLASSTKASSQQGKSASPLEALKGTSRGAAAGDLASSSTSFTPSSSTTLSGDQSEEKSSSGTPLEKMKGGNKDAEAGDLASTPVEFTPTEKDPLLKGDSPAQKDAAPDSATPLEKMKGGNKDVKSGDLASTSVEFTPSKDEQLLDGDSKAQQSARDTFSTPLGRIKGVNEDVEAGDLASTPVEFTPSEKEPLLKRDSPAQQGASSGSGTPLEKVKGGNEDVKAGNLASNPVEFTPTDREALLKASSQAQQDARAVFSTPLGKLKGINEDVEAGDLASDPVEFRDEGKPLLQPDSPAQPGKTGGQTPLQRMKGKGTPYEPVLSSNVPFRPGFKESLLARTPKGEESSSSQEGKSLRGNILQVAQLAGLGRALQLLTRSPEAAAASSPQPKETGLGTEGELGSTPDRAKAGLSQSNVLQLQTDGPGKSISMRGFSSRASGSAASVPYEIGKSAIEQELPEKQPPARRSAARPNPSLRVQTPSRPAGQGVNIPSLTKSSAASGTSPVYPYVGRANVPGASKEPRRLTPQEQLQAAAVAGGGPVSKGRTAVENWLLVLGSGLVGSLVGLTWRLVQGFAVAEPVNKALMAAIIVCMVLIVILTSLDRPKDGARPAAA